MIVTRRNLLGGFATFPLIALVSSPPLIAACGSKPPDTPFAHLYGQEWVHSAYKLYGEKYVAVQEEADRQSQDVYRVLAQKGIPALDGLQAREVPFFVRVDPNAQSFAIERKVPERLTFAADMTDADRKAAQASGSKAQASIHTDYEEVRRLDSALTRVLQELQRSGTRSRRAGRSNIGWSCGSRSSAPIPRSYPSSCLIKLRRRTTRRSCCCSSSGSRTTSYAWSRSRGRTDGDPARTTCDERRLRQGRCGRAMGKARRDRCACDRRMHGADHAPGRRLSCRRVPPEIAAEAMGGGHGGKKHRRGADCRGDVARDRSGGRPRRGVDRPPPQRPP